MVGAKDDKNKRVCHFFERYKKRRESKKTNKPEKWSLSDTDESTGIASTKNIHEWHFFTQVTARNGQG